MNVGAMKDIVEIYKQDIVPGKGGQMEKTYTLLVKMRGDWKQIAGREFIMSGAQLNTRQGTLLTRYYKDASEKLFIKINYGTIYEVVTFNHSDNVNTLWNLSSLA